MDDRLICGVSGSAFLLLAALLFLMAPEALAQDARPHKFQAFAQFGGAFYTQVSREFEVQTVPPTRLREDDTFGKTGRLFTGIRWNLTDKDQIEVAYSFGPGRINTFITGSPSLTPGAGPGTLGFFIHHYSFSYVRAFQPAGRVQPFLSAGAGLAVFVGGIETETKPAGNLGIGMDVRLTDRWFFCVEQRAVISGAPRGESLAREGILLHFVPSAGFVFRF